jgi:hypothetical protein
MPDTVIADDGDAKLVARYLRELEKQIADRATFESHWQEIGRRLLPRANIFKRAEWTKGERRTEYVFNSKGPLNLERFAALFNSLLTPATQKWHKLRAKKRPLNKTIRVSQYCEDYTNVLFEQRYRSSANFAAQNMEVFLSSGAFGTGFLFSDANPSGGWLYKSGHLAQTYLLENAAGRVDRIKRKFKWRPYQAAEKWGRDALPAKMQHDLENSGLQEYEFVHVIEPNPEYNPRMIGPKAMKYTSTYISVEGSKIMERGGFRTFPVATTRYVTNINEGYGRGPGMTALPDLKMVNEIDRSVLRVAQNQGDPPIIAKALGQVSPFQNRPGFKNYGWLSDKGEPLVQYMNVGGKLDVALKIREEVEKTLDDIFFITLFQILADNPQLTATEVLERAREKGVLMAPFIERAQQEYLGTLIVREIDLLEHSGLAPEMPPELQDDGGRMEIVYESPLVRAQKAEQGLGFMRVLQAIAPLAAGDPSIYQRFNKDEIVPGLAELHGMPMTWLHDEQALAAIQQQAAQQSQQQQMQQAVPQGAAAAKDLAAASQMMNQGGGGGPIQ